GSCSDAGPPDALSPDALSPDARSPDALSPDTLSPDALSPDALWPDALSPVVQTVDASVGGIHRAIPPVSDPTPCMMGHGAIYLAGDPGDYVHPGVETIAISTSTVSGMPAGSMPSHVRVWEQTGSGWDFEFSTGDATPLAVGIY